MIDHGVFMLCLTFLLCVVFKKYFCFILHVVLLVSEKLPVMYYLPFLTSSVGTLTLMDLSPLFSDNKDKVCISNFYTNKFVVRYIIIPPAKQNLFFIGNIRTFLFFHKLDVVCITTKYLVSV